MKRAFTLLELIIVIIIVGVLASLALPRFFSTVESARSVEALANLKLMRERMELCYLVNRDYGPCQSNMMQEIGNELNTAPGKHFTYSTGNANAQHFSIRAMRNTFELIGTDPGGMASCYAGGSFVGGIIAGSSAVVLCQNQIGVGRAGSGFYKNIK